MISGIILAGGKGTRIHSVGVNKVVLPYLGKPMIQYGVELLNMLVSPLVVVVGAYAESVKDALKDYKVVYAVQEEQRGTGHAVKIALPFLASDAEQVIVGYGDHMMFYKTETIQNMLKQHMHHGAAVTLVTTTMSDPQAYGRIIRNEKKEVCGIVEYKDATTAQRSIQEINAGLYCFDRRFLENFIFQLKQSPVSHEYYLTDLIGLAVDAGKYIVGYEVPYQEVGIGINTKEEFDQSVALYHTLHGNNQKST